MSRTLFLFNTFARPQTYCLQVFVVRTILDARICSLSPGVPIIALTAFAYDHDRKAALEAGCNDFLTKPFTQEKLKETIKKWVNK